MGEPAEEGPRRSTRTKERRKAEKLAKEAESDDDAPLMSDDDETVSDSVHSEDAVHSEKETLTLGTPKDSRGTGDQSEFEALKCKLKLAEDKYAQLRNRLKGTGHHRMSRFYQTKIQKVSVHFCCTNNKPLQSCQFLMSISSIPILVLTLHFNFSAHQTPPISLIPQTDPRSDSVSCSHSTPSIPPSSG
jgi:hypothetical protein